VSGLEHPTDAATQMLDEGSEPSPIEAADGKVSIEQDLSCLMRSVLQVFKKACDAARALAMGVSMMAFLRRTEHPPSGDR